MELQYYQRKFINLIGIIDYGVGNLGSLENALNQLGEQYHVASCPTKMSQCNRYILPGVGNFAFGSKQIFHRGWNEFIESAIADSEVKLLGICLGMQLLSDRGFEYGEHDGLGLISGEVRKLRPSAPRTTHIGWNSLIEINTSCPLLRNIVEFTDFYFVNSYYFKSKCNQNISAKTEYGDLFPSVIRKKNVFGVQFHPEKSSSAGLKIIKNFIEEI